MIRFFLQIFLEYIYIYMDVTSFEDLLDNCLARPFLYLVLSRLKLSIYTVLARRSSDADIVRLIQMIVLLLLLFSFSQSFCGTHLTAMYRPVTLFSILRAWSRENKRITLCVLQNDEQLGRTEQLVSLPPRFRISYVADEVFSGPRHGVCV